MAFASKTFYLIGFGDGTVATAGLLGVASRECEASEPEVLKDLMAPNFTIGDVVSAIDGLYGDPANLNIPIASMHQLAVKHLRGVPDDQLKATLTATRQVYNSADPAK